MSSTADGEKKRIAIFASGGGTNALNIIQYFKEHPLAQVVVVLSNRRQAGALDKARKEGVAAIHFKRDELEEGGFVTTLLERLQPNMIVLAGFLLKFPEHLVTAYENRVINIHPALLPKYGGKGMYGQYVHQAVIANGEAESGITIHYVNEAYDEGAIIFQKSLDVQPDETPESLANRIHELEHAHFPQVIEQLLENASSSSVREGSDS